MKGHSERVPGKNLRLMAGKPLFHWITECMLAADGVDDVIVDTDSDDIAKAVRDSFPSVSIHSRPVLLHGDMVPMHEIVTDVARDIQHDHIVQTHSTNPLLRPETVSAAIRAYLETDAHDSLMSVTSLQARLFFADGRPINHDPSELLRTQDLEPVYVENSNLYIAPRSLILERQNRLGANPLLFPIARDEAVDIDEELDFKMAEFLLGLHRV